ncbi:MAG TPA: SRPBCC family protein [Longimicrobiaceae bacterium]|jgi:uncharacterized protein YndB with AHSA1/START domain|nr:SRPBCC family protein [Longimicrobiaceae bacterium]
MATETDRIEKRVLLHAPIGRVWGAVSDAEEFGCWFGVRFDGPFVAGKRLAGRIVPTSVDEEVAEMQGPLEGTPMEIFVERIEPTRLFSFRWHPGPAEPGVDYSKEPATLVTFELEEVSGGTMLTIVESGFDSIPLERRAAALAGNEEGWAHQARLIEKYLRLPV